MTNPEQTLQSVRDLSEGHATRHPKPRRRISYKLTRGGRLQQATAAAISLQQRAHGTPAPKVG